MPTFEFTSPEGKSYTVEGPAGATQEQAFQILQQQLAAPAQPSGAQKVLGGLRDAAAGAVRGAGSIGATIVAPIDIATDALAGKGLSLQSNRQRRADMDAALAGLTGADPNSLLYRTGKLAGEVAGTAGAGGVLANGLRVALPAAGVAAPTVNALATGLQTGGFSTPGLSGLNALLARMGTGAVTGGAMAGMVDPANTSTGMLVGGLLPPAVQVAGKAGEIAAERLHAAANRLMQSAIKPTIKQLRTGDADIAVRTLLDRGINPTRGGVEKLRALIEGTDDQISSAIAGSNAMIDKGNVVNALGQTRTQFGNQVSPAADLSAIQGVEEGFLAHPNFPLPQTQIPVQAAQDLKRGTYQVLSKKYGQMGSAEVEAQKALARGLKDEIATAVPEVSALNAEQSRLLTTLNVAERRALMEMNKNPMGLAALAHDPKTWALFMADKSALFKSLAARLVNQAPDAGTTAGLLTSAAQRPLVRSGAVAIEANP